MTPEEAREALKQGYQAAGFKLVESEATTELKFSVGREEVTLTAAEIEDYARNKDLLLEATTAPSDCGFCGPTLREQLIDTIGQPRLMTVGPRPFVLRQSRTPEITVTLGRASDLFIDYFRFEPAFLQWSRSRALYSINRAMPSFRDLYFRPLTIQVSGMTESTTTAALAHSDDLINASMFAMSYMKNRSFRLVDQWPAERSAVRLRRFSTSEVRSGFEVELPPVKYNDDVLRFYHLGRSTEIPELQFLSFYQVLEYFFVSVSDHALYEKLKRRLADPVFRHDAKHLDRLIQDVVGHAKLTDETEMLKLVIDQYVDAEDLQAFIKRYEEYLTEPWYTKKRERFGVETEVKFAPGHLVGNVAKILRTVRNALVHSSDRYERIGRHLPFSDSSALVKREVPIVQFLAERVIVATADAAS